MNRRHFLAMLAAAPLAAAGTCAPTIPFRRVAFWSGAPLSATSCGITPDMVALQLRMNALNSQILENATFIATPPFGPSAVRYLATDPLLLPQPETSALQ